MDRLQVIVTNQSGAVQNYKLLSQPPVVTGGVNPQPWSNVFQTADYTQPGAVASFTIWKNYYGVVGTVRGSQADGAQVAVSQTSPVELGFLRDNGTVVPGTSLIMNVAGGVQPYFETRHPKPSAYAHCFSVETRPNFTVQTAKDNNFMLGIAGSPDGDSAAPLASFMPEPGVTYQIQPSSTFYLTFGGYFSLGRLADIAKIGNKVTMDFAKLPSTVHIMHTATGKLVIQQGTDTVWK